MALNECDAITIHTFCLLTSNEMNVFILSNVENAIIMRYIFAIVALLSALYSLPDCFRTLAPLMNAHKRKTKMIVFIWCSFLSFMFCSRVHATPHRKTDRHKKQWNGHNNNSNNNYTQEIRQYIRQFINLFAHDVETNVEKKKNSQ